MIEKTLELGKTLSISTVMWLYNLRSSLEHRTHTRSHQQSHATSLGILPNRSSAYSGKQ